jgi:LmbE family N-acetylglucosaminyl deacetylase
VESEGALVILVLAPHMDDEALGCGGLILKNKNVHVLFFTEADKDRRLADGEYVEYDGNARIDEMHQVADLLGFGMSRLGLKTHMLDTIGQATLLRVAEEFLPLVEVLVIPCVTADQDHRIVHEVGRALMRPHCFAGTVLEYSTWCGFGTTDDVLVLPMTLEEQAIKEQAVKTYRTQQVGGPEYVYSAASCTAYAETTGRLIGVPFAEGFRPLRIVPNETTRQLLCPTL